MHTVSFISICLLHAACVWKTALGLTCLSCYSVPDITHCSNSVTCMTNTEQCFMDKTVLSNLTVVFTAGCRETQICNILEGLNGKRDVFHQNSRYKKSAIECTHCCNSAGTNNIPCNRYLCNQMVNPAENTCAVCDRVSSVDSCTVSEKCPSNEVCIVKMKASGSQLAFELGCEQKMICDHILQAYRLTHSKPAVGRSDQGDVELCAACCTGQNCNKANCLDLIKNQTCLDHYICGP